MAWKWEDGFVGGFIFIFTSQKTPHVSSVCLHLRIYPGLSIYIYIYIFQKISFLNIIIFSFLKNTYLTWASQNAFKFNWIN